MAGRGWLAAASYIFVGRWRAPRKVPREDRRDVLSVPYLGSKFTDIVLSRSFMVAISAFETPANNRL